MSRRLRRLASPIFGVLGGSFGFLWSYIFLGTSGDGCSCGWSIMQTLLGWPMLVGSIIGLGGAVAYIVTRKIGGLFLLAGAILASPLLFFIATGYWTDPVAMLSISFSYFGFLIIGPSSVAALLLFIGGLLSFSKTRHLIRTLHDGGWIP